MNGWLSISKIFFSFSIWSTCLLSIISFFFMAFIATFLSLSFFNSAYLTLPKAPKWNNKKVMINTCLVRNSESMRLFGVVVYFPLDSWNSLKNKCPTRTALSITSSQPNLANISYSNCDPLRATHEIYWHIPSPKLMPHMKSLFL